jgi:hypothetical protein
VTQRRQFMQKRFLAIGLTVIATIGGLLVNMGIAQAAYTTTAAVKCVQANHGGNAANGTVALCGWIKQIRDSNTNQVRGTVAVISAQDQGGNVQAVQVNMAADMYSGGAFSGQNNRTPVHADVSGCVNCGATSVSATSNGWANTVGVFDGDGGSISAAGNVSIRWADGQLSTLNVFSNLSVTYRCAGLPSPLIDCGSSNFSINP